MSITNQEQLTADDLKQMLKLSQYFFKTLLILDRIELEKRIEQTTKMEVYDLRSLFKHCVVTDILEGTATQEEIKFLEVIINGK